MTTKNKRAKERLHRVMVIGATPSGIAAVNKLGELGIPVTLVDGSPDLNQRLSREDWRLPSGLRFNDAHRPGLIRIMRNPGIRPILPAEVTGIKHNAQGFAVTLRRRPTYVDASRCVQCGRCATHCTAFAPDGGPASRFTDRLALPGRPVIDKRRLPLCAENCPLGVNAQGYVALAKAGKYDEALALIREKNVLPGICGRICHHPCESACRRGEVDEAVSIRAIKRFLADHEAEQGPKLPVRPEVQGNDRYAVIGSGPSGLAAAAELARNGRRVTVFEKEAMIGGLLRYGIGPHRLPRNILDAELAWIEALGVEFVTNHPVDMARLADFAQEYAGVILATGSWKDRPLGAAGEDLEGVEGGLAFLNRFHRGEVTEMNGRVAVIGDGNGAFDLARTLTRLGADVTLLSWFGRDKIPADAEEVEGALIEGVTLVNDRQVVTFLDDGNGRFRGVRCLPTMPGPADARGVAWPVPVPGAEPQEMPFDRIFVAIGQLGPFPPGRVGDLDVNPRGFIAVNERFETSVPGVYATGDAASGPSAVVKAMSTGRALALRLLGKTGDEDGPRRSSLDFPAIPPDLPRLNRMPMPETRPAARCGGFTEVALGLSEEQIRQEAGRCLQCGVCSECLECVRQCGPIDALRHDEVESEDVEQAGVLLIADPDLAPPVRGEDVIRSYGPPTAKPDVPDMITRGFAAAAQALVLLRRTTNVQRGNAMSFHQPSQAPSPEIRIGVFACRCNDALGWSPALDDALDRVGRLPDVVHAQSLVSACVPEGAAAILRTVREKGITRLVLGSCVCCPLDFACGACTDQRSRLKHALFMGTGVSRAMTVTRNIRGEALSLLNREPELAVRRFEGLLARSVRSSRSLRIFAAPARTYNFTTAVIGDSEPAVASARFMADAGMEVLVFGEAGGDARAAVDERLQHPNIHYFAGARVHRFGGTLGNFHLDVETGDGPHQTILTGAVIIGERSRRRIPYLRQEGLPEGAADGHPWREIIADLQTAGIVGTPFFYPGMSSLPGLLLADPPGISVSDRQKGAAAAALAASVMPRGPRRSKGYTVSAKAELCRGCGRCAAVCPYQAVTLNPTPTGGWVAVVDEAFCKGCGNCISVCPSNAADSPYRDQVFFEQTLEEILLR